MSSSAPRSAGSKGDASFDSVFVSPGTRRQPLSASGTPVLENCPGNDDEQERKQRRRSRVLDLQFSAESPLSLQSPSSKQTETSLPAIPQLTNAQIADHYSTCIKLSTENKITTKNAFGLHLIDYMTEILKQKDSELTNFKVAAGTLDASAKIYAVRVDAVHADVYRVLGGLGKDAAASGPVVEQDAGEGDEASESSRKPVSKRKHLYKTIERNLNNINLSEADRRGEGDPMLQKTATSFDECSTAGVFLTMLHTHSYLSEVLFESRVTPLPSSAASELPSSSPVKGTDLRPILLQCVEKRPICPSLTGFLFTQWNSETHNESVSALLDKFKKSDQAFDVNAEVDSDPGAYDEGPVEDNDFDADLLDKTVAKDLGEFSGKLEACTVALDSSRKGVVPLGEGDVGSMCLHLSSNPSEYSYFSPRTMSMWAGPEHWRFKPRHKGDINSERISKRKSAKKVFEINFNDEIEFERHFRKTRAATTLAKATLESQNKKSNTLPADFHYDPDSLARLFLKPANRLWKMPLQGQASDHDDEVGEYDYNNPNDASNFCPALQDADSDDDNDPVDFMGQDGMFEMTANPAGEAGREAELNRGIGGLNITTYGELNLVSEPQKVNKIDIHFAKTAKKMDMKSLKRTMWCLLTDAQKSHTEEANDFLEKSAHSSVVAGQKVFSSITQDLLRRLPSTMAKNLSVPLAFACLLHLANEKNLKLEGVEDLSEVLVLQGD